MVPISLLEKTPQEAAEFLVKTAVVSRFVGSFVKKGDQLLQNALIGAGVGGLGGLGLGMFGKRRKNPLASALTGALAGGAIGGGLSLMGNNVPDSGKNELYNKAIEESANFSPVDNMVSAAKTVAAPVTNALGVTTSFDPNLPQPSVGKQLKAYGGPMLGAGAGVVAQHAANTVGGRFNPLVNRRVGENLSTYVAGKQTVAPGQAPTAVQNIIRDLYHPTGSPGPSTAQMGLYDEMADHIGRGKGMPFVGNARLGRMAQNPAILSGAPTAGSVLKQLPARGLMGSLMRNAPAGILGMLAGDWAQKQLPANMFGSDVVMPAGQ